MSQPKFVLKRYESLDYADIKAKIEVFEAEWLTSLLIRNSIPKIMIDKARQDPIYSKGSWRDFVFERSGLLIVKDIESGNVTVTKIDHETGNKLVIASWNKPEILRIKDDDLIKYELNLKYWQIA